MFDQLAAGIRQVLNKPEGIIPLHAPWFDEHDEEAVAACVRSTFVSSVGKEVDQFEKNIAEYTGSPCAVATVNGTAALHISLLLAGAKAGTLVITQPLTFIATCNAITYTGARPVFIDVDPSTLGMSPDALQEFLETECDQNEKGAIHKRTGKRVVACVPMHTLGHPAAADQLQVISTDHGISLIEDAAESLGSHWQGTHTGTFGRMGTISFNGNKIITCGGGGAILCRSEEDARQAKHLTTQAKMPHRWKFEHDNIGYNYRMPNINAALALSQMKKLDRNVAQKRELAEQYRSLLAELGLQAITEPEGARSNYWLNAVLMKDEAHRDDCLSAMHEHGIQVRPGWELMTDLALFHQDEQFDISNSINIQRRLVCLPSSASE